MRHSVQAQSAVSTFPSNTMLNPQRVNTTTIASIPSYTPGPVSTPRTGSGSYTPIVNASTLPQMSATSLHSLVTRRYTPAPTAPAGGYSSYTPLPVGPVRHPSYTPLPAA